MGLGDRLTRLVRVAAVIVVMTMIAGMAPGRTLAAQERGGGDSYTSDEYGYTVTWDGSVWDGTPLDGTDGVELMSDVSYARINVIDSTGDPDECLNTAADLTSSSEGIEDFGAAPRRLERPETGAPASDLFTFTDLDSGDTVVAFIECRALPAGDATLNTIVMAYQPDYADALPTWNDLLGELDRGIKSGRTPSKGDKGDTGNTSKGRGDTQTGLDGDVYTDAEAGFTVTASGDWSMRELTKADDVGKGVEVSSASSFGYVTARELDTDLADCAANYAEGVGAAPNMSRMKVAPAKYERPQTARKAIGELYTFTLTTDNDSTKLIGYFECRALPTDGEAIEIFVAAPLAAFDDELPVWEDLLGGIEIDGGSGSTGKSDTGSKGDTGKSGSTTGSKSDNSGKSGNKGGKDTMDEPVKPSAQVVTPNFGVVVGYDDSVWTARDDSSDVVDAVQLESDAGYGTVVVYGQPYDTKGCFETVIALKVGDGAEGFDVAPASMTRPAAADGAVGELFTYTLQGDNGPFEAALYVECRPVQGGNATLGIAMLTVSRIWDQALPQFEAFLAGVGERTEY